VRKNKRYNAELSIVSVGTLCHFLSWKGNDLACSQQQLI